jgi:translation initiation factor 1A
MAKGAGNVDLEKFKIERQEGQQLARVLRALGNLNMSCFCNDGKTRICRVRGKMIKREFVEQGDIVLISLRDLDKKEDKKEDLRGDILAKYPYECISDLRKEEGVNDRLFVSLEQLTDMRSVRDVVEQGWEFDNSGDDDEDDEDDEGDEGDDQGADGKDVDLDNL